jgi:hypothetical protein
MTRNDGLAYHFDLFVFAVVLATQALGFHDFKFFGVFLANLDQLARAYGGRAELESIDIFTHHQSIGEQGHEPARHDDVAGENAFFLDVIVVERVRQDKGVRLCGWGFGGGRRPGGRRSGCRLLSPKRARERQKQARCQRGREQGQ